MGAVKAYAMEMEEILEETQKTENWAKFILDGHEKDVEIMEAIGFDSDIDWRNEVKKTKIVDFLTNNFMHTPLDKSKIILMEMGLTKELVNMLINEYLKFRGLEKKDSELSFVTNFLDQTRKLQ